MSALLTKRPRSCGTAICREGPISDIVRPQLTLVSDPSRTVDSCTRDRYSSDPQEPNMERRLAAVVIADVAGYGRLSQVDEEGTRARFQADVREIFAPRITEHHGRLVK